MTAMTSLNPLLVALLTALLSTLLSAPLTAQRPAQNLDFEQGRAGGHVSGWFVPPAARSFAATLSDKDPKEGKLCVQMKYVGRGRAMGNIMQNVDASPYRGKTIRFSGHVRVQGRGGRAQPWLSVDRPDNKRGFFDNMGDRPLTSARWKRYQIIGKVHEDARNIRIGMMVFGRSTICLDGVKLEVIDDLPAQKIEPARALSKRGLDNIMAFAHLYGYVRYFHPSSEAQKLTKENWERFVVEAVRGVEAAKSPAELEKVLRIEFSSIAPTVRVATGGKPKLPDTVRKPPEGKGIQVVAWNHFGMGPRNGGQSLYKSNIVEASLSGGGLKNLFGGTKASDLPAPNKPFVKRLPGGVTCLVPLALYKDKKGTLPHRKAAGGLEAGFEDARPLTGDDRATRIAAVIVGWNVFQHFYPYFDVVKTDWSKALPAALKQAATDKDAAAGLITIRKMVAALHDGHGYVGHSSDPATAALPVEFGFADDKLILDRIDKLNGGAATASLQAGDVVLKINGKPARKTLDRIRGQVSASTEGFARWRIQQALRRGPANRGMVLELLQKDGKTRKVTLLYGRGRPLPEDRPDKIKELEKGIWYVDVSRIDDNDFKGAIDDLAKARSIIFDFRGYPGRLGSHLFFGHLTQKPIQSAQWHVPIPKRPDREGFACKATSRWRIAPRKPYFAARKVFIIDGRAISYAESCMGIVEHYKMGEVVGEATAGTNGNVNPVTLPGGYRIAWTGMKVLKHDGSQHHGVGILPTVPVARTVAGVRAGRDEYLEKALEVARRDR